MQTSSGFHAERGNGLGTSGRAVRKATAIKRHSIGALTAAMLAATELSKLSSPFKVSPYLGPGR